MFTRRLFRGFRKLASTTKHEIFSEIDNLPIKNKSYESGIMEAKDRLTDIFRLPLNTKDYIGMVDASLYVLEHDVPKDPRYKVKDKSYYQAMHDAFSVAEKGLKSC
jgi:hypothetical protein